jgi:hypothetical protein
MQLCGLPLKSAEARNLPCFGAYWLQSFAEKSGGKANGNSGLNVY